MGGSGFAGAWVRNGEVVMMRNTGKSTGKDFFFFFFTLRLDAPSAPGSVN